MPIIKNCGSGMDETDGNEDYDTIISADDGRAILGAQVETHHHIQSQAQRTARTIVAVVGIVATIVLTNPNVTIFGFFCIKSCQNCRKFDYPIPTVNLYLAFWIHYVDSSHCTLNSDSLELNLHADKANIIIASSTRSGQ